MKHLILFFGVMFVVEVFYAVWFAFQLPKYYVSEALFWLYAVCIIVFVSGSVNCARKIFKQ